MPSWMPNLVETHRDTGYAMNSSDLHNGRTGVYNDAEEDNNNNNNNNGDFRDEPVQHSNGKRDRTFEEKEKEETFNLEEDLYSLMYLCQPCSITMAITFSVFLLQITILLLILTDVTRDAPLYNEIVPFPLYVPIDVPTQVAAAQFVSLVVATLKEEDIFISLKALIIVGHDERVSVRFPGASPAKWWLANILRFITGLGTISVSFFFIAGSSDVLDIFSNFAAMEFISYIDNMVYKLARWGYTGKPLQRMTIKVESVTMENRRKQGRWWALLVVIFLGLTIAPLTAFWAKVRIGQSSGFYLEKSISTVLAVEFGDEEFSIPRSTVFNFQGTDRDLSSFDPKNPPNLKYSYFSGNYETLFNDKNRLVRYNDRPIYYERNSTHCETDPSCGMFYYCGGDVGAWVYTVKSLGTALKELDKCEWGWLARSNPTEVYSLEETSEDHWKIWTGVMTTVTLTITNDSCEQDSDCSLNGVCEDGACICEDNWQGDKCTIPYPFCPAVAFFRYGKSTAEYQVSAPLVLALDDDGSSILVYERPVYFKTYSVSNSTCSTGKRYEIYLYTGRRWHLTMWCEDLLERYVRGEEFRMEETLHAFWDNILGLDLSVFSPLTGSYTGIGMGMMNIRESYSTGNTGSYGLSFDAEGTFECLDIACADSRGICGRKGTCGTYTFNAEYGQLGNQTFDRCECRDFYGGPFCQFSPNGDYAKQQFEEFQRNATMGLPMSIYNEYQSTYWEPWWESGAGITEEEETTTGNETNTSAPAPSDRSTSEDPNIFSNRTGTEQGEL